MNSEREEKIMRISKLKPNLLKILFSEQIQCPQIENYHIHIRHKFHASSKVETNTLEKEDSGKEEKTAMINSEQQPTEHDIVGSKLVSTTRLFMKKTAEKSNVTDNMKSSHGEINTANI